MEPWMVMLSVLIGALALWYVPLAIWTHRQKKRPARRCTTSYSTTDADTQAALTTVMICSTVVDASHHG